jgi:hypothetical protein
MVMTDGDLEVLPSDLMTQLDQAGWLLIGLKHTGRLKVMVVRMMVAMVMGM